MMHAHLGGRISGLRWVESGRVNHARDKGGLMQEPLAIIPAQTGLLPPRTEAKAKRLKVVAPEGVEGQ